jgi:hypothetical protein
MVLGRERLGKLGARAAGVNRGPPVKERPGLPAQAVPFIRIPRPPRNQGFGRFGFPLYSESGIGQHSTFPNSGGSARLLGPRYAPLGYRSTPW